MTEISRGHRDNAGTQIRIAENLGIHEGRKPESISLVRLTPPEYHQLRGIEAEGGKRVAIINLQHYEVRADFPEFAVNQDHYGLCIGKPGVNTSQAKIEPQLDETKPVIVLRLEDFQLNLNPNQDLRKEELMVDQVVLGNAVNVKQLIMNKYAATMTDTDFNNHPYYLRIYTVKDLLQLSVPHQG